MAEHPGSGLTSGDPLRPGDRQPPPEPDAASALPGTPDPYARGAEPADATTEVPGWRTPARPAGGYGPGSPVPPGAGGAVPAFGGPGPVAGRHALAGWWRRAGAAIIDGAIVGAAATILLVPLGIGLATVDSDAGVAALIGALIVTVLVFGLASLAYAPLMLWKTDGRTLGRMATGIRVVRADGSPMTLGVAVVREVVLKAVVFGFLGSATIGFANLLDVLWPLWDEERRALHDFPVNTRTVLA